MRATLAAARGRVCCGGYALVFMDINMPIMDGYSATMEIRKTVPKTETRVVAASAYPPSQIEERTKEAGMDGAICKPINDKDIAEIMKKYYKARGFTFRRSHTPLHNTPHAQPTASHKSIPPG